MRLRVNKQLFGFLVENMPGWTSTAEGFKSFVVAADALTFARDAEGSIADYENRGIITPYGRRFAKIIYNELNINLEHYLDLDDLLDHCLVGDITGLVYRLAEEERTMYSLDDELLALGMEPSEETIREILYKDMLVEVAVKRLSPYIDFV